MSTSTTTLLLCITVTTQELLKAPWWSDQSNATSPPSLSLVSALWSAVANATYCGTKKRTWARPHTVLTTICHVDQHNRKQACYKPVLSHPASQYIFKKASLQTTVLKTSRCAILQQDLQTALITAGRQRPQTAGLTSPTGQRDKVRREIGNGTSTL